MPVAAVRMVAPGHLADIGPFRNTWLSRYDALVGGVGEHEAARVHRGLGRGGGVATSGARAVKSHSGGGRREAR